MWTKNINVYNNAAGLIKKICWQHTIDGFVVSVCAQSSNAFNQIKDVFGPDLKPFIKFTPHINWIDFEFTNESRIHFGKFLQNLAGSEPQVNEIASQFEAEANQAFLSPPAQRDMITTCPPLVLFFRSGILTRQGIRASARITLSNEDVNFNVSNTDPSVLERVKPRYARKN